MKDLKGLLSLHCISHRLNLAVTDLWKGDKQLQEVNLVVYNLCKLFSNSSTKLKILLNHERYLLDRELNLIKPIDVRWMSKFSAIKRILNLYPAIIAALSDLARSKDLCSAGLLFSMKSVRTLGHLLILRDLGEIIDPLNQLLQRRGLEFEQLEVSITLTKIKIEKLCDGDNYRKSLQSFLNSLENPGTYNEIRLLVSPLDLDFIKKTES